MSLTELLHWLPINQTLGKIRPAYLPDPLSDGLVPRLLNGSVDRNVVGSLPVIERS